MRKPEPSHLPRFASRRPGPGPRPGDPPGRSRLGLLMDVLHKLLTGGAALATILRFLI
jgi:hypothetical protein